MACDTDADCGGETCVLFSANNGGKNGGNNGGNNGNNGQPGLTCAGVLGCFDTCEGAECDECFGRVQPGEESDRLQALFVCAQVNGCNDDENGDCIGEFCLDEAYDCLGYGDGTQECRFFFECSGECNDDQCEQECLAQLDQEGLEDFFALVECGETSGCVEDYQCLLDECGQELGPCLGTGCGDNICAEGDEETCPQDCQPSVRYRFAMIEDRSQLGGPFPGADIDAVGLIQGDREHFVAAIEDAEVAVDDNEAADPTQLVGPSDAGCDADRGAHVSLGGQGNWISVSWGTRDEDVIIRNGNVIRVYELGELLCNAFDNDPYAVSVSSDLDTWIEIGEGGVQSNDIVVSGL